MMVIWVLWGAPSCNLYLHVSNNSWLCASYHVHFFPLKYCELCLPFHIYWWNCLCKDFFSSSYSWKIFEDRYLVAWSSLWLLSPFKDSFQVAVAESGHKVPAFLRCQYCLLCKQPQWEPWLELYIRLQCTGSNTPKAWVSLLLFFFFFCQFDV